MELYLFSPIHLPWHAKGQFSVIIRSYIIWTNDRLVRWSTKYRNHRQTDGHHYKCTCISVIVEKNCSFGLMYTTGRLTVSPRSDHGQLTVTDKRMSTHLFTPTTMLLSRVTQIIAFSLRKDVWPNVVRLVPATDWLSAWTSLKQNKTSNVGRA